MFPDEDKKKYDLVIDRLKSRFKPVDIEEPESIEFHQKMQDSGEYVEKLGICLQKLAGKAFPQITGKEFDRLLRGRFFQALLPKWQRKLGVPKLGESFSELYNKARTLEHHEKQFSEVAVSARKSNVSVDKKKETSHSPTVSVVNEEQSRTTRRTGNSIISHKRYQKASVQCFQCKKLGHYARECPLNNSKMEAHGQSSAKSAVLTATPVETESALSSLSIEQLEEQLAQQKLSTEVSQMQSASTDSAVVRIVESKPTLDNVVGPTPHLELSVGDVNVSALVDSVSQSTIISREFLHKIAKKARSEGKPLPSLKLPTVKLFGKGDPDDRRQLDITAQVELEISADG